MEKGKDEDSIPLESGANEIKVMKLSVLGESYGINVAKVQEIIMNDKVKPTPHVHPAVEDAFKPRDMLITIINPAFYLSGIRSENDVRNLFVVMNSNRMTVTFRTQSIEGISRISQDDAQKPDKTISNGDEDATTGIAQCDNQLVIILDFGKIVAGIVPETMIQISEIGKLGSRSVCDCSIVTTEDSILLRKMIDGALERAGFTHVTDFSNGQEAWDYLQLAENDPDLYEKMSLAVTDIETPKMDGHRLTKLIKEDSRFRRTPIVISSSLTGEQMRKKDKRLGTGGQLAEPEIGHLVSISDELLGKFDPGWAHV